MTSPLPINCQKATLGASQEELHLLSILIHVFMITLLPCSGRCDQDNICVNLNLLHSDSPSLMVSIIIYYTRLKSMKPHIITLQGIEYKDL